jgi:hypothetical protein
MRPTGGHGFLPSILAIAFSFAAGVAAMRRAPGYSSMFS